MTLSGNCLTAATPAGAGGLCSGGGGRLLGLTLTEDALSTLTSLLG